MSFIAYRLRLVFCSPQEDEAKLQDAALGYHERLALQLSVSERRILDHTLALVDASMAAIKTTA